MQLLNALTLEHSKLRTAASMAVASVAKEDFPDSWPELIPHVLQMLQAIAELYMRIQALHCLFFFQCLSPTDSSTCRRLELLTLFTARCAAWFSFQKKSQITKCVML